jgi:hypothetical protein
MKNPFDEIFSLKNECRDLPLTKSNFETKKNAISDNFIGDLDLYFSIPFPWIRDIESTASV